MDQTKIPKYFEMEYNKLDQEGMLLGLLWWNAMYIIRANVNSNLLKNVSGIYCLTHAHRILQPIEYQKTFGTFLLEPYNKPSENHIG